MSKSTTLNPKTQRATRAPRFSIPNKEAVVLAVGPERLKGTLCILSRNGGTMQLPRRYETGTFADFSINTVSGRFTAAIELLAMTTRGTQAFRFVQMEATDRRRLEGALDKMRAQESDGSYPGRDLLGLARRMLFR
jgi:hypothetical protein